MKKNENNHLTGHILFTLDHLFRFLNTLKRLLCLRTRCDCRCFSFFVMINLQILCFRERYAMRNLMPEKSTISQLLQYVDGHVWFGHKKYKV